jgi:hypothetical protein
VATQKWELLVDHQRHPRRSFLPTYEVDWVTPGQEIARLFRSSRSVVFTKHRATEVAGISARCARKACRDHEA